MFAYLIACAHMAHAGDPAEKPPGEIPIPPFIKSLEIPLMLGGASRHKSRSKRGTIAMKAVSSNERIPALDIIRGLAILGILFVNMTFYNTSLQAIQWQIELWPKVWDRAVQGLIMFFVQGKFMAVFSFLFGYGMMLFRERSVERGRRFAPLYVRRLLALLAFALIHGWFIWFGDILIHYVLLGFALLLFHKSGQRRLLFWAVIFLAIVPVLILIGGDGVGPAEISPEFLGMIHERIAEDHMIYSSGSYADIQARRMSDWYSSSMNMILFYPQILGLFLAGAYFAKARLLHDVEAAKGALIKIARWTGGTGLLLTLLPSALNRAVGGAVTASLVGRLDVMSHFIGAPLLGIFYVTFVTLLISSKGWERALRPLAHVGRMAFTNYIMQSVVFTWVFYSYGLGLYGKVGPLLGAVLTVAMFALQVWVSGVWLRHFQTGPLEWLWRAATYMSLSPIQRQGAPARRPSSG